MKSFKLGNVTVNNNQGIRILPDLYVGDNGEFPSGSILDANATSEMIKDASSQIPQDAEERIEALEGDVSDLDRDLTAVEELLNMDQEAATQAIDTFTEILDFLDGVVAPSTLASLLAAKADASVVNALQTTVNTINNDYVSSDDVEKLVVKTEAQWSTYTPANNTITFVV